MLTHTHDMPRDDGAPHDRVSQCSCGSCQNVFWVRCASEFQPSYCPYCGIKFRWYDGLNGDKYKVSGQRIEG